MPQLDEATAHVSLFPLSEYWWFYAGFTVFVLVLLSLDLGVFHREDHKVTFKEAGIWAGVWVSLALLFNAAFYFWMLHRFPHDPRLAGLDHAALAHKTALEFLAGYVVEYSLSIDNIFVFVLVMGFFAVPAALQHRVLFFGILGALVFRGIFIAMGALLLRFEWVVWLFGAFLVITGVRMMFGSNEDVEPEENAVIRAFRRKVPVTAGYEGHSFFVRRDDKTWATPLFIALMFLEMTD